ncbi:MAG: hydrolase [Candidatus Coatesbacteria bacterium]|nr:hydrolase [Candidatus Coatesbacteria bacterium]
MNNQNAIRGEYTDADQGILVMIIDHQEKLLPHIFQHETVLRKVCKLVRFCKMLSLPTIFTEQYPQGLGPTAQKIAELLDANIPILQKTSFSCMRNDNISRAVGESGRTCVVVSGIETHICVAQTVCDLLSASYSVHVLSDCVGARTQQDHEVALQRMHDAGAVISTLEAFMYETLGSCKHPMFKRFLREIMN